jgi:hypothetical protein
MMNILQTILRLLRRALLWFLALYWVGFIVYTIKNLATGGPSAAVAWYRHISGGTLRWDWRAFLAAQMVILAITLALWFFGRRPDSGVAGR